MLSTCKIQDRVLASLSEVAIIKGKGENSSVRFYWSQLNKWKYIHNNTKLMKFGVLNLCTSTINMNTEIQSKSNTLVDRYYIRTHLNRLTFIQDFCQSLYKKMVIIICRLRTKDKQKPLVVSTFYAPCIEKLYRIKLSGYDQ